jgi:gamma-glutamyl:cysteine ligase YbdK (ATP-grasp superfamily)
VVADAYLSHASWDATWLRIGVYATVDESSISGADVVERAVRHDDDQRPPSERTALDAGVPRTRLTAVPGGLRRWSGLMGVEIDRDQFDEDDYRRFAARLAETLEALASLITRPDFGVGPPSIGAELELSLVDRAGRPMPINRAVLAETVDPRITLELARFNLEINTPPCALSMQPFGRLAEELESALAEARRAAAAHGGRIALIGIVPTLTAEDLGAAALTDANRYRALSAGLRRLRSDVLRVRIRGEEEIEIQSDDIAIEGANTSFQVHLRVAPEAFADTYNAAQIATAPVLAAATNAPLLFGRRIWEETRICLFRQTMDDRCDVETDDWRPARVSFGHGWVRKGVHELFAESVALHEPLLPVCGLEDPRECLRQGGVPRLAELCTHSGTVWRWNRPVYDAADGGHVRIEFRALPSGPTVIDMTANAAFLIGLTLGLLPEAPSLVQRMTFEHARRNFYLAARHGLDAELLWPSGSPPSPRAITAGELVKRLLPIAERGLVDAGVDSDEAAHLCGIIERRVARGVTGARWQRRALDALAARMSATEAARAMFEHYLSATEDGRPVHEWGNV